MSLSPRPALASLSATEILARDKEGFPRKSSVTFGEVVSTFSKYGSVASRRHGGIYISKSLKIPNRFSTISDNTLKLEQTNLRDSRDSLCRSSPRSSYSGLLGRSSRTPSPCSRRPRSLPVTPRSGAQTQRSSWEPRRKEWSDFSHRLNEVYGTGAGGFADVIEGVSSRPRLPAEPVATTSSHSRDPTPRGTASLMPGGTFCGGSAGYSGGGTGGSSGRHALKAKPSLTCFSCGNGVTADAAYCRHCGAKRVTNQADSSSPALSPSSQVIGYAAGPSAVGRSFPVLSSTGPQPRDGEAMGEKWSTDFGRIVGSPKGNPRVASFVRLNGFLLRTHITSLLSALAEDGWLEAWEKERLCSSVRDAESRWAQSFLQIYMRFVETDDVATFVAALKAQIS